MASRTDRPANDLVIEAVENLVAAFELQEDLEQAVREADAGDSFASQGEVRAVFTKHEEEWK